MQRSQTPPMLLAGENLQQCQCRRVCFLFRPQYLVSSRREPQRGSLSLMAQQWRLCVAKKRLDGGKLMDPCYLVQVKQEAPNVAAWRQQGSSPCWWHSCCSWSCTTLSCPPLGRGHKDFCRRQRWCISPLHTLRGNSEREVASTHAFLFKGRVGKMKSVGINTGPVTNR